MKPQSLVYHPTHSRRLNEMFGLVLLVAAGLLSLSLLTYNPADPSLNTVGGAVDLHPAHNWTGLVGSYTADLLLQGLGVAVFLLPLLLLRTGISWMRSRSVGSSMPKLIGLVLWLVFAPAAIALLPGRVLWKHAVPLMGVEGRILSDGMVHFVNLPGAAILCSLMVAISLYLVTSFTLTSSADWWAEHFAPFRTAHARYTAWQESREARRLGLTPDVAESKAATRRAELQAATTARTESEQPGKPMSENTSLLAGFLRLFRRRGAQAGADAESTHERASFAAAETPSVWASMPLPPPRCKRPSRCPSPRRSLCVRSRRPLPRTRLQQHATRTTGWTPQTAMPLSLCCRAPHACVKQICRSRHRLACPTPPVRSPSRKRMPGRSLCRAPSRPRVPLPFPKRHRFPHRWPISATRTSPSASAQTPTSARLR